MNAEPTEPPSPEADALGIQSLRLLRASMRRRNPELRALACSLWGWVGNPAAAPLLKEALLDTDGQVRVEAAKALWRLGDRAGLEVLMEAAAPPRGTEPAPEDPIEELRHAAKNKVKASALLALGELKAEESREVLGLALMDPSGVVRDAASIALARLGDEEAVPKFVEAAGDEDEGVRFAAAKALGLMGNPKAVGALENLAKDPAHAVRAEAMRALGRIGGEEGLEALEGGLKDKSELVRSRAVEALGDVPGPIAIVRLRQALNTSKTPYIQLAALRGLLQKGQTVDLNILFRSLRQKDPDVRLLAAEALKYVGKDAALPLLQDGIKDEDERVRLHCAAALVKLFQRTPSPAPASGGESGASPTAPGARSGAEAPKGSLPR